MPKPEAFQMNPFDDSNWLLSRRHSMSRPTTSRSNFGDDAISTMPLDDGGLSVESSKKYSVMVRYLYTRIRNNQWLPAEKSDSSPYVTNPECYGVLLRQSRGQYVSQPTTINSELLAAIQKINVEVAFTMISETTDVIFSSLEPGQTELIMEDGSQLQIVESMAEISRGASCKIKKFQYACLVKQEGLVLIWHDDLSSIINHAHDIEKKLITLIWGEGVPTLFSGHSNPFSSGPSSEYTSSAAPSIRQSYFPKKEAGTKVHELGDISDAEKGTPPKEGLERPLQLASAFMIGLATCLMFFLLGLMISKLLGEYMLDGNPMRFALTAAAPVLGIFGLFFVIIIFTSIFQTIGPIGGSKTNSRYHSALPPNVRQAELLGFKRPHMTIQMPVYKESLAGVIKPTVKSLKAAISHYELCGGTANIFINDDGLALLNDEDAKERINFYHDNNIGWVARPPHNSEGFIRAGKFKKASNMNYALNFSNKVEEALTERINRVLSEKDRAMDAEEEEFLYQQCLEEALEKNGRVRASGNVRIGEFILIVDSDTRVPADCLLLGAAELFLSPEVAIVQHSAGVMQVVGDYFENGITFFTNLIYSSIRFTIGSGEVAPFMGHNAFLRWSAVQGIATVDSDGYERYWSESHVSEDFDIALRAQIAGCVVRLASYHDDAFKEGVSLTIYDEITRWQKYAYGCNELVWNPLYQWIYRGPITPTFRQFLWCKLQLSSKIAIIGYIATYSALASGLPLTIFNYFLIGWFNGYIDTFYMESWKVFVGLLIVFGAVGNVTLAILRYRLGEKPFFSSLLENFKWQPMLTLFFSGISFHLNMALLSHILGINMEWAATAKELENSNFWKEVPKIFKTYRYMYAFCVPMIGGMIYLGLFAPHGWNITMFTAVVPLAVNLASHVLLPFVMNPALMVFNY